MSNIHLHRGKFLLATLGVFVIYICFKWASLISESTYTSLALEQNQLLMKSNQIYNLKNEWFLKNCIRVESLDEMSLDLIDEYVSTFSKSRLNECKTVHGMFTAMFDMDVTHGEIRFESFFESKMLKWLDNKKEYLAQAKHQKLIRLYNKFYMDEMIYNALRGKRPVSSANGQSDEKNYSYRVIEESLKDCDFCNDAYKTNTANDVFERLETKLSYSATNAFKYDKWHSLIFSRNHNTLNMTEEECVDMFDLGLKWFERVYKIDSSAQFPQIVWDAMPKSGASQPHTHIHVSMGINSFYGQMRRWLHASKEYYSVNKRDFFDDFILIHKAFGLVYELDDSYVIVNLIPVKDQELMIVGKTYPNSYSTTVKLFHQINRIFIEKFQQYSLSAAMFLPKFESAAATTNTDYDPEKLTKIFARILFRSSSNMVRSDFNGLDLYTSSVIGIDRYKLASKLFKELDTFNSI